MMGEYSHKKNVRIAVIMWVAFMAVLYLMTSCTAAKINRKTSKNESASETKTNEAQNKQTNLFDRSFINEEDYSIKYIPVDPTKEMGHTTNPETGAQTWQNAIPVYEKKTKQTSNDITKATTEAKTTEIAAETKATTTETTKDKIKFSVPWYAYFIVGFFCFLILICLVILWMIYNKLKTPLS